jgi:acetyltransferase
MGRREACEQFRQKARAIGIPVYADISRLAECLRAISRFSGHKAMQGAIAESTAPSVSSLSQKPPLPSKEKIWDEYESKTFLATWEIPVVEEKVVDGLDAAWKTAQAMGLPVVLKGLLPGEVHKTEHGLVQLGITDKSALEAAFHRIQEKLDQKGRILVQRQVRPDYELIAGFIHDNQFGPCVMFGLGGIFSELAPDVVFALAPLDRQRALQLITRIRSRRLLQGFRGLTPLNEEAMADILVSVGMMGVAYPQIEQIDINPVIISKGVPVAVDATVILKSE